MLDDASASNENNLERKVAAEWTSLIGRANVCSYREVARWREKRAIRWADNVSLSVVFERSTMPTILDDKF